MNDQIEELNIIDNQVDIMCEKNSESLCKSRFTLNFPSYEQNRSFQSINGATITSEQSLDECHTPSSPHDNLTSRFHPDMKKPEFISDLAVDTSELPPWHNFDFHNKSLIMAFFSNSPIFREHKNPVYYNGGYYKQATPNSPVEHEKSRFFHFSCHFNPFRSVTHYIGRWISARNTVAPL